MTVKEFNEKYKDYLENGFYGLQIYINVLIIKEKQHMDINGNYIQNQFCSYEIALKLKDLGFNKGCFGKYYTLDGKTWQIATNEYFDLLDETYDIGRNFWINAPLWQQAIDWLREKYQLHIEIELTDTTVSGYYFEYIIRDSKNREYCDEDFTDQASFIYCDLEYKTYEEAREQAILKAIELCKKL